MGRGVFDRFKSLPMARIAPLAGALMADIVRYFPAATVTFGLAYVIGYRPGAGLAGVVPVFAPLAVDRYRRAAG